MNFSKKFLLFLALFSAFIAKSHAVAPGNSQDSESANIVDGLRTLLNPNWIINLIGAVIIVGLTFFIAKLVRNKIFTYLEGKLGSEGANKQEMISMTSRIVNITIIITGLSIALGVLGVDMTIFMGGIGFGIGFTLKTFLSNFIAGVIMVSQGTYHSGDFIEVESKQGHILKINTLFTTAQQLDGVVFSIPNINFLEKEVKNFHSSEKRRIDIELHFDYDADIIKIKSVLKKVGLTFDEVMTSPEAKIIVEGFDDSYIKIQYRPWILSDTNYVGTKSNILETINLAFKQSGIEVGKQKITVLNEKSAA